ncbi:MAG: YggS family pyridoxal phosphate-dependent enzyme [Nanoarchaeota archaeon]|nr:YggS family pyridoxal phosphate-dependent enzyme [Nanoarchaeota archaeon]MBU1704519.1 YggS family pyridoxal phosphate-dependent enzyme [Nanoarchaeota archaeon]
MIKDNITAIRKELPKSVIILAATKKRTVSEVNEAISYGIDTIGENYVQEAKEKFKALKGRVKIHCIGHLQTNKVKDAVLIFDLIETVDSLKIAREIDKRSSKVMPILIEVNSGKEENKGGCMPEDVLELVKDVSKLKNLKVKGLMTMAPNVKDVRPYFKLTKDLFDKIKNLKIPNVDMEILSMGMSDSYKVAAQEGANLVRIGTGIFGSR